MTDDNDQPLSPEQENRIRSALTSARATGPPPDHVVARLDAALADLVAERDDAAGPAHGPGQPRTRRTGRWLLLAGAASVAAIAAFGIPAVQQGLTPAGGSSDSAKSAEGTARSAPRAQSRTESQDDAAGGQQPLRLSSGSFRSDVRRQLDKPGALAGVTTEPQRKSDGFGAQQCTPGAPPPGVVEQRRVLLDGEPALLEVFGTRNGSRLVRAVSCDGGTTLASTRIPER